VNVNTCSVLLSTDEDDNEDEGDDQQYYCYDQYCCYNVIQHSFIQQRLCFCNYKRRLCVTSILLKEPHLKANKLPTQQSNHLDHNNNPWQWWRWWRCELFSSISLFSLFSLRWLLVRHHIHSNKGVLDMKLQECFTLCTTTDRFSKISKSCYPIGLYVSLSGE